MSSLRALSTLNRFARPATCRAFHASSSRKQHFLNANEETFLDAIARKDRVVLVDFYADWCGPCKTLSPLLENLTSEKASTPLTSNEGKTVDLVTVDIDNESDLAAKYQIRSVPTVIAFKEGKPVSQFVGAMPEGSIRNFMKSV